MDITVNGTSQTVQTGTTISQLIRETDGVEDRNGIAVAINDEVVPRSDWDTHQVSDGDRIEIIQAVQGG